MIPDTLIERVNVYHSLATEQNRSPWTDLYLTTTRTTKKDLSTTLLTLPTPLFAARRGAHDSVFASTSLKRVRKLHITMINGPRNIRKNQRHGKKKKKLKEIKDMIIPTRPPPKTKFNRNQQIV